MKKTLLLAAAGGLTLVGASPPALSGPGDDEAAYPPCSSTVTDRCIQLHERGVANPDNLALNDGPGAEDADMAMGGPFEGREGDDMGESSSIMAGQSGDYPPCSATVTDRCVQGLGHGSNGRSQMAAKHREHQSHTKAMRYAMRAGERG